MLRMSLYYSPHLLQEKCYVSLLQLHKIHCYFLAYFGSMHIGKSFLSECVVNLICCCFCLLWPIKIKMKKLQRSKNEVGGEGNTCLNAH